MFFSLQDLDTTLRILDEGRQTPFIYIKIAFCVNLMVAFPSLKIQCCLHVARS